MRRSSELCARRTAIGPSPILARIFPCTTASLKRSRPVAASFGAGAPPARLNCLFAENTVPLRPPRANNSQSRRVVGGACSPVPAPIRRSLASPCCSLHSSAFGRQFREVASSSTAFLGSLLGSTLLSGGVAAPVMFAPTFEVRRGRPRAHPRLHPRRARTPGPQRDPEQLPDKRVVPPARAPRCGLASADHERAGHPSDPAQAARRSPRRPARQAARRPAERPPARHAPTPSRPPPTSSPATRSARPMAGPSSTRPATPWATEVMRALDDMRVGTFAAEGPEMSLFINSGSEVCSRTAPCRRQLKQSTGDPVLDARIKNADRRPPGRPPRPRAHALLAGKCQKIKLRDSPGAAGALGRGIAIKPAAISVNAGVTRWTSGQAKRTIDQINCYLQKQLWFDFEVLRYQLGRLVACWQHRHDRAPQRRDLVQKASPSSRCRWNGRRTPNKPSACSARGRSRGPDQRAISGRTRPPHLSLTSPKITRLIWLSDRERELGFEIVSQRVAEKGPRNPTPETGTEGLAGRARFRTLVICAAPRPPRPA